MGIPSNPSSLASFFKISIAQNLLLPTEAEHLGYDAALPHGWWRRQDIEGDYYIYDILTGESTWEALNLTENGVRRVSHQT